uniref:Uncharacterized protein n=1 Tax=Neobodo designis TaxID=312471 RepID=A0A7S1LB60_NEODS
MFLAALLAAAKAHPFDPDAPVRAVARVSDVHEREVRYLVGVLLNALKWRVPATRDETVAAIGNAVWQGLATARSDTMSVLTSTLPVSDGDRRLVVADPAWLRAKPPPAATTTVLRSPLRASTHTPLPSLSSPLQPPPPAPDPARGVYGYFRHEAGSLDTADTVDVNLIAIDQPVHQRVVSENLLRQIDPNTVQVLNDVDQ